MGVEMRTGRLYGTRQDSSTSNPEEEQPSQDPDPSGRPAVKVPNDEAALLRARPGSRRKTRPRNASSRIDERPEATINTAKEMIAHV